MSDMKSRQQQAAAAWTRAASSYSHTGPPFFQYFGKELVNAAGVPPGARVLDIATGRGAVLFPAAEKVGHQGEVIGIDYSEGMVEETNAEIRSLNIENARVLRMSAEQLEFDDSSFDMVFCSFAVFFFPHPDRALSEFRRVLKADGKLLVSTWGKHNDRWAWLEVVNRQWGTEQSQQQDKGSAAPVFNTQEGIEKALSEAGFTDIRVREIGQEFMYASADEWWATQWSHGARIFLERIPPEALEQGRAFAHEKMAEMAQPEGIPMLMRALFASATKG